MKKSSFPKNWDKVYSLWKVREITGIEASKLLDVSRVTFYNCLRKQRESTNGHEKK